MTSSAEIPALPPGFLRTLEADLRALCADAKRRNPDVKQAAERVILLLKEADNPQSERAAADEAASAFCAACEQLDPSTGSNVISQQVKVALRAVSCLHKLLTHRALSSARLSQVLAALQRLSVPAVDDNLTLKVLQGVLSLLTVRAYAQALSGDELSRAFSLLFVLKTARSAASGNAASSALSAISQLGGGTEGGVIEQTAKAAFRQVASDLFAAAADAAVRTAVQKQKPMGEAIALEEFPGEVGAAYSLFGDLCSAAGGADMQWLGEGVRALELGLVLEVVDDGLSGNIALFGGQAVFADVLRERLCPVVEQLLETVSEKNNVKSLLGLVVTLVRHYWRTLGDHTKTLLHALVQMTKKRDEAELNWGCVYAVEALRCIFRIMPGEANVLINFVREVDLKGKGNRLIADVTSMVVDAMAFDKVNVRGLTPGPLANMKPFANIIANTGEFLVSIASAIFVQIIRSADEAVRVGQKDVARVLLAPEVAERAIEAMGKFVTNAMILDTAKVTRSQSEASEQALGVLAESLGRVVLISSECAMDKLREKTLETMAKSCRHAIHGSMSKAPADEDSMKRAVIMSKVLLDVVHECREELGRSWVSLMEALEQLDMLIFRSETHREMKGNSEMELSNLSSRLSNVFASASELSWESCHDMISALVQCSRQTVMSVAKKSTSEEQGKESHADLRVFGISRAEETMLASFGREDKTEDAIPGKLWQLLTGHLISVCTDSSVQALRKLALGSLMRIACGVIPNGNPSFVGHDRIVTPFLDLLSASYADVRSGSLASVYVILEAQGERLDGEAAWGIILKILSKATGATIESSGRRDILQHATDARSTGQIPPATVQSKADAISEAFKSVQVISDNYLTSLTEGILSVWIQVLGFYCRQDDDVNVALTSIGLLWRTADFFGKSTSQSNEDLLWVQLFETLKDISMDERPEIRNSAVKTLTGTLSAHNIRLSATAWNQCVAKALLPLLEQVMKGGMSGQSDENGLPGKSRGDLQLLLHHSRDTPRKQWNETKVLALAGVAKVLRTAMPRLAILQDDSGRPLFMMLTDGGTDGLWRKMLRAAGVAASSRDREVAVAGASALLELLNAAGFVMDRQEEGGSPVDMLQASTSAPGALGSERANDSSSTSWISGVIGITEAADASTDAKRAADERAQMATESTIMMWEAVWSALSEAISRPPSSKDQNGSQKRDAVSIVDEKALLMLAEGLLDTRKKLANKFTTESSRELIEVLMYLALDRRSIDAVVTYDETVLTPVQETTLQGLERLSFGLDSQSWSCLVQSLVAIVNEKTTNIIQPSKLVRRVVSIIGQLYNSEELPGDVKRSELESVLRVMGRIMLLRDKVNDEKKHQSSSSNGPSVKADSAAHEKALWMKATEVVMIAMQCAKDTNSGALEDQTWEEFVNITENFLYSPQRVRRDVDHHGHTAQDQEKAETYDIQLTSCVQDALSQVGPSTSKDIIGRLVGLLSRGAEEGKASRRPLFVRSCQKRLFYLANGASSTSTVSPGYAKKLEEITEEANRRVVETCGRVLGEFVADGHRAGRCPLPAVRRAEAVFLLQQLRKLNSSEGGRGGLSKKHLVTLYPRLCECVDCKDEAVRQLARELLDEAAPVAGYGGKQDFLSAELRA